MKNRRQPFVLNLLQILPTDSRPIVCRVIFTCLSPKKQSIAVRPRGLSLYKYNILIKKLVSTLATNFNVQHIGLRTLKIDETHECVSFIGINNGSLEEKALCVSVLPL